MDITPTSFVVDSSVAGTGEEGHSSGNADKEHNLPFGTRWQTTTVEGLNFVGDDGVRRWLRRQSHKRVLEVRRLKKPETREQKVQLRRRRWRPEEVPKVLRRCPEEEEMEGRPLIYRPTIVCHRGQIDRTNGRTMNLGSAIMVVRAAKGR